MSENSKHILHSALKKDLDWMPLLPDPCRASDINPETAWVW